MDYITLHDIDFKQSLRCSCPGKDGVPSRICAGGIMLGFKEEQVSLPFLQASALE